MRDEMMRLVWVPGAPGQLDIQTHIWGEVGAEQTLEFGPWDWMEGLPRERGKGGGRTTEGSTGRGLAEEKGRPRGKRQ